MLVVPDIDKWTNDSVFYTDNYIKGVKEAWLKHLTYCNDKALISKKDKTKNKYKKSACLAIDSLSKIEIILNNRK